MREAFQPLREICVPHVGGVVEERKKDMRIQKKKFSII